MRCPHCRMPMDPAPKALKPLSAEHGTLRLTLENLPACVCPDGHHAPVDADFMLWLIYELKERAGKLPAAEEKGLLRKKSFCACGEELGAKPDHREIVREAVSYESGPAFSAQFDFAMHRCPACGTSQLRSGRQALADVSHCLAGVTDAARFPHA